MLYNRQGSLSRIGGVIQSFERFIRKLQTDVEHTLVTNSTVIPMPIGSVLALTAGVKQAVLADASNGATPQWAGILCKTTAAGAKGIAQTNGRASVLFDALPTINTIAFVSETAGMATGTAPVAPLAWVVPIGRIVDVSGFAATGRCDVILGQCCPSLNN